MNIAPRTLVVVRNPYARRAPSEDVLLRETVDTLVTAGWGVDIQTTRAPGHATEIARRAAAAGVDVVAACGGDGTVSEVVEGLTGTRTALAVLPAGTADVWAREALIPRDLGDAVRALTTARRVRVDVGRVRVASGAERRFLLMCSVGMDAEVVRRVEAAPYAGKRSFGRGWYAGIGAYVFGRSEPAGATVSVDGTVLDGPLLMAVAGNTRLYGGVTRLTAAARADDGVLDLCTFAGDGLAQRVAMFMRALRGGLDVHTGDGIDYRRGARIEIATEWPLPVQADGDYIGTTPVSMWVEPGALMALIGPQPNVLFSRG